MPHLGFPSRMHLKRSSAFGRLKQEGKRVVSGCLILNWIERPVGEPTQMGMIVTKRIGRAVVRNRARRLIRETFRLNQHALFRPVQMVLIARQSICGKKIHHVESDFIKALEKAGIGSRSEFA